MKELLLDIMFGLSLSVIIAMIYGIYSYGHLNKSLKIIFYYTVVSSLMGSVISIMSMKGINNIFLVNIFAIIEFIMIALAYYFAFDFKKRSSLYLFLFGILFGVAILFLGFRDGIGSYNNELQVYTSLVLIVLAVAYLLKQFRRYELNGLQKPVIFMSLGVFMYFSSSFLIVFAGSNNALLSELQVIWIYLIHSIFYFIFVVTLIVAFSLCMKPSEHSSLY